MPPETTILQSLVQAETWQRIGPPIFLAIWGLVVLLIDVGLLRHATNERRRAVLGRLTLGGVVVGLFLAMLLLSPLDLPLGDRTIRLGVDTAGTNALIFGGTLSSDAATAWMTLLILALTALVAGMAMTWDFTDY